MLNRKTVCLACCLTLLTACGSDSEFKRQVGDNVEDYLNTPELKPLIIPNGMELPKTSNEYQVPKAFIQKEVGYDIDIRPPVIPKSVIGMRPRYNENGMMITSYDANDWTKIRQAVNALAFPIVQENAQKIETGTLIFDSEDKDGATQGQFEIRKINETEIAFQAISLTRNNQKLDNENDIKRYTLVFYNLIMSEIESPKALFTSNQSEK